MIFKDKIYILRSRAFVEVGGTEGIDSRTYFSLYIPPEPEESALIVSLIALSGTCINRMILLISIGSAVPAAQLCGQSID